MEPRAASKRDNSRTAYPAPRSQLLAPRSLHRAIKVREVLSNLSPGHGHQAVLDAPRIEEGDRLIDGVVADHRIGVIADDRRRSRCRLRREADHLALVVRVDKRGEIRRG